MKKLVAGFLALGLLLLGNVPVDAGPGKGDKGRHFSAGGTSVNCVLEIYEATSPISIEGIVTAVAVPGGGIMIETETSETETSVETVYGIGPEWYWQAEGLERPTIADSVSVEGYALSFLTGTKIIAMSLTIGGETLELRDPETGCPLWR